MERKSFAREAAWLAASVVLMAVVSACGRVADNPRSASGARTSPSQLASPSPTGGTWQVYSDSTFAFSISYPSGSAFKNAGTGPPGVLAVYRVVDNRYLTGEPPEQVDLAILTMDADNLTAWIKKHTGSSSAPPSQQYYWESTSNVVATTAAGRSAVRFDNSAQGFPATVHGIIFLLTPSRIFNLAWWSTRAESATTIGSVAQEMLASFKG